MLTKRLFLISVLFIIENQILKEQEGADPHYVFKIRLFWKMCTFLSQIYTTRKYHRLKYCIENTQKWPQYVEQTRIAKKEE